MSPRRTLTLVKTDIRKFTERVSEMSGSALDAFLREHRSIVEPTLRAHGGRVVKEMGDSFLATFESSTDAVLACIAVQRELALHESRRPTAERVEIRIAVHTGDVVLQDGDVFGTPVNAVARLETVVPAGEIYLSEAVRQNLNPSEVAVEPVGVFSLKGLQEPLDVHRTTFRHQTRVVPNAAVLICDLEGFTRFAESAPLRAVEDVLEAWDRAQREAAATAGGVVRAVLADMYLSTYDQVTSAIEAWQRLARAVVNRNRDAPAFGLRFSAGIAAGEVRLFRTALYGRPTGQASLCERISRDLPFPTVVLTRSLFEGVQPESRRRFSLAVSPAPAPPTEGRAGGAFPPGTELVALRLADERVTP